MFKPIKVVDVELSHPIPDFEGLDGYDMLHALVRIHGTPLGYVYMPVPEGRCTAAALTPIITERFGWPIVRRLMLDGLSTEQHPESLKIEDLVKYEHPVYPGPYPLVTVAVCTRNRTADLETCLEALYKLEYPNFEVVIIDNAPSDDSTEHLVRQKYPQAHYVRELRPGLSWARNRSILEANGEIIAWTDDDVIVDPGWLMALVKAYADNPEAVAVTGLVVPYELETESQWLFERHGGFNRGFERKAWRVWNNTITWHLLGAGQYGTGANMSFRRSVFARIGSFDPALGAGTVTQGAEDLEMFFRVLKEGYELVYEPAALVRHRHRRNYEQLRSQLESDGIALYAYFVQGAQKYPELLFKYLWLGLWWFVYGNVRRLWISLKHPSRFPRDLIWAELLGCFKGLTRYQKATKIATELKTLHGSLPPLELDEEPVSIEIPIKKPEAVAVRKVDLSQPLQPLTDIKDYSYVHLYITWKHKLLGIAYFPNPYDDVPVSRLREAITDALGTKLLEPALEMSKNFAWARTISTVTQYYCPDNRPTVPASLATSIAASIVVATLDRPDDLRHCLQGLVAQETARQVEIIVVDNNPASGLTPPVVAEFPKVVLIGEPRRGLAYARNAGIIASRGDIIVSTDDDVTLPSDWLEKLLVPFNRPDVMAVTGNVLPLELETPAQILFEVYGGLGRGFWPFEVNGDWIEQFPREAAPTWKLGATANAAFRASIFRHPEIGLMEEALGPGMPSGVGEDTYLFYKIVKAGGTIVYEPKAFVWHKHRREMAELRRQIYNYSKGHVAYHLTTWQNDGDWRAWWQILVVLPRYHAYRIKERFLRRTDYPIPMVLLELAGNLAGPWSLWRSQQRVKREGRSASVPTIKRELSMVSSQ